MPEKGGTATQAGIFYQNSVAAHAMADMLDFDPRSARERAVEIRLEAPEPVDDLVIRYADGHREYCSVKLELAVNDRAWKRLWRSLAEQHERDDFTAEDVLTIVVCNRGADSTATFELCERALTSLDDEELRDRLSGPQAKAYDSIKTEIGSNCDPLKLLRRITIRHRSIQDLEHDIARRELAGSQNVGPAIFVALRDIAGGESCRRGLFRPASLRRRLKLEHGIILPEPNEWGLAAYRDMLVRLAQIAVPGTKRVGPADELFVWPRARDYDNGASPSDFEDELVWLGRGERDPTVDLSAFPSDDLDKIVVVAGPGHGKSAMLTALSGRLATSQYVPVTVPLASLAESDLSVLNFLTSETSAEFDVSPDWRLLAEHGLLVLLFDGLDEVPGPARTKLLKRIAMYSARNPRSPWMMTVRDPAVVQDLPAARMIELLQLDDDDMTRFVETICHKDHRASWDTVRQLSLRPDLYKLARIPLFLVMLLVTTDLEDPAPVTRSDLIEAYLKTLFSPAEHKETADPVDRSAELRAIAASLAFERLERQEIGATEREVRDVIARLSQAHSDHQILFERLIANGILRRQSSIRLQFPYPIVQEYLAASYLIENQPETLPQRIEDAIHRPWAQVIQFALELYPEPEPLIVAMLERPDDAFRTGLRLLGRCIANGAKVCDETRDRVGDQLVDYWITAPYSSRERLGRLLADGFLAPPSESLRQAVHHRWLINDGGGEIVSRLGDIELTVSVVRSLMSTDAGSIMIYHSLKPALNQAGDRAIDAIIEEIQEARDDHEYVDHIASLFDNFETRAVSRERVLAVGDDDGLPLRARLSAYALAGPPLSTSALNLVRDSFGLKDSAGHYDAVKLLAMTPNPAEATKTLILDSTISIDNREYIAGSLTHIIPDLDERRSLSRALLADTQLDERLSYTLELFEARHGDRSTFERLLDRLNLMPLKFAGTTIALFGHYRDAALCARAVATVRSRKLDGKDAANIASQAASGMRYIFDMDFGFGGALRNSPPHPGTAEWLELLESWLERTDLKPLDMLEIATAGSELGSDLARSVLRDILLSIEDFDDPRWLRDKLGNALTRSLRQLDRSDPILPMDYIERLLSASQYNIASHGVTALLARSDREALDRLITYHPSAPDWMLRDMAADKIEIIASRLGLTICGDRKGYSIQS